MRHEMLTQRAPFCDGMLSQHSVTNVVRPLKCRGQSSRHMRSTLKLASHPDSPFNFAHGGPGVRKYVL